MKRTALFIDGPNLYATAKALGMDVDFKRLLAYYEGHVGAYYYTALVNDGPKEDVYVSIRPLVDWLEYNGYTLVTKMAKQFTDQDGRTKVKGNMDCELIVDALELVHNRAIDEAIFFTGDGDFEYLIIALQRYGIRCTVVSSIKTQPSMCADELRRAANTFIDLVDLGEAIGRPARISKYA